MYIIKLSRQLGRVTATAKVANYSGPLKKIEQDKKEKDQKRSKEKKNKKRKDRKKKRKKKEKRIEKDRVVFMLTSTDLIDGTNIVVSLGSSNIWSATDFFDLLHVIVLKQKKH